MEFNGKKVLVTGSTRGIGNAIARRFITDGARVAINGRSPAGVNEAVAALHGAAVGAPGDLTTAAGCEAVVGRAIEQLGRLDVLINNAGVFPIGSMEDTDEAVWDETLAANVKSVFFTSRAALAALREAHGVIVNHSSIAGLIGLANVTVYCASKGAVVQLTKAMAMELAPEIRVNCVCPTTVDNDMGWQGFNRADDPQAAHRSFVAASKLQRMPTNDDVVEAFAFLASNRASFMTGVALPVDGGKSAGV